MLEPLFNKVPSFKTLKSDSNTGIFSCEYCEILKKANFEEHLRTADTVESLTTCD